MGTQGRKRTHIAPRQPRSTTDMGSPIGHDIGPGIGPGSGRGLTSLYGSFTASRPYSMAPPDHSRIDTVREISHGFRKKLALPFLAALAAAGLLSGCAVVVPEAVRQVKQLVKPPEPVVPSDQRLVAQADAAIGDGDYAAAEAYLDAVLSTNPFHRGALSRLAQIYRLSGRKRKADELDPPDHDTASPLVAVGGALIAGDASGMISERFATLERLRDAGLIAPEEFSRRRSANLGALLPLTQPPPALLSSRPAPRASDIIARLEAIAQFHMNGALDVEAYEAERGAILDGLMPLPSNRGAAAHDTASVDPEIHQARLDRLLAAGLISAGEYAVESAALVGLFLPAAAPSAAEQPPAGDAAVDRSAAADGPPALEPGLVPRVDIHLAMSRTPERAKRNWEELQDANSDVLAGLEPRIARIDLGDDKGIFFQLSAGPLVDMAAAEALCDTLARRRLYCAPMIF